MIILTEPVHPHALALLQEVDVVRVLTNPVEFDSDIDTTAVCAILTRGRGEISNDLINRLPNLRVIGRCGVGLDNISLEAAADAGVVVVYAPGSTTRAVSEMGVLLMLGLARNLRSLDDSVRSNQWDNRYAYIGSELAGKTLGIVGLGAIGMAIGNVGDALGMNVVTHSRATRREGWSFLELEQVLAVADVVQLCVPFTPQTRHMIGAAELRIMRPSALLINTARGALVDHVALREALFEGRLGGYGADVWEVEPPSQDDELLKHPAVLVTPHVAGLTDKTFREICLRPAQAIAAILRGEIPDPSAVYHRA